MGAMLGLGERLRDLRSPRRRLGVSGVVALRGGPGQGLGALVGGRGGLTALFELHGRRLWLDEAPAQQAALDRLGTALSGPPVQVLLCRRRADVGAALAGWERLVRGAGLAPEQSAWLREQYANETLPALSRGGLGRVWTGLAVAGRDPATLAERAAWVRAPLGGMARPLGTAELADWLGEWFGGALAGAWGGADLLPVESVLPAAITFAPDGVGLGGGTVVSLWAMTALPPLVEVGWARHLLSAPELADAEYDLALHCSPVGDIAAERQATERELAAAEARLAALTRAGRAPVGTAMRELEQARAELLRRRRALAGPGTRLRRLSMLAAVRRTAAVDHRVPPLIAALERLGWTARPIRGRSAVEAAWRGLTPGAGPPAEAPAHLLTAGEVAPLAWWAVAGDQPPPAAPVITVSAERTVTTAPIARDRVEHLLVTGAPGMGRSRAVQGWALALAWRGAAVVAIDPAGSWAGLGAASGGRHRRLGSAGDVSLDPVGADGYRLDEVGDWSTWLADSGATLRRLLDLNDDDHGAVQAALIELGLAAVAGRDAAGLAALARHLHAGGHGRLAEAVVGAGDRIGVGRCGAAVGWAHGLTVVGWDGDSAADRVRAMAVLLRHLHRTRQVEPPERRLPAVLVVDDAASLVADEEAGPALVDVARAGGRLDLRLWLVAGRARDLTGSVAGRQLLAHAGGRVTFGEPAAVADLVDGLGWPPPAARSVAGLPPGVALIRAAGEALVGRIVIGDLVAGLVARGGGRPAAAPMVAPA